MVYLRACNSVGKTSRRIDPHCCTKFPTHFRDAYPEPDYENLGYSPFSGHSGKLPVGLGLFFDDPFQASDNVSREFLFHRFMLSPGRFIAIALTDPLFPSRKRQHR